MSILVLACLLFFGRLFFYRDDNVGPDVIIPDNVDQFGMVLED